MKNKREKQNKSESTGPHLIFVLEWTEYESGWGCRPDGSMIFISQDKMEAVILKDAEKRLAVTSTPSEYSIPSSKVVCSVNSDDLKKIKKELGHDNYFWVLDVGSRMASDLHKKYPSLKIIAGNGIQ